MAGMIQPRHLRGLPAGQRHAVIPAASRHALHDAGDLFQGTLESNLAEGADVIKAYNQLGYGASAIGNHEFDYGPEGPQVTVKAADEDPRGEDRIAILDDIARGAEDGGKRRDRDLFLIADRPSAIDAAFERARPGDIVLLAGKGHEQSIIGPDGPVRYDERATALAALARLGYDDGPDA